MFLNISDELIFACVSASIAIIAFFVAIIVGVRNRKSKLSYEESDFISRFFDKQKQFVASVPGSMNYTTYITLSIIIPVIAVVALYLLMGNGFVALLGLLGVFVPRILIMLSKEKREKEFEERYARALRQISSSLHAGMSLEQALDDLCVNPFIHNTVKDEFMQINSDIKVGISIPEAFRNSAERLQTSDAKDVAAAILIQSEVGGNEAKTIESISNNIGTRIMLRKEISSMFAGVKATTTMMSILPFGVIAYMFVSAKAITDFYFESPINTVFLVAIILFMAIGVVVIRKMLKNGQKGVL